MKVWFSLGGNRQASISQSCGRRFLAFSTHEVWSIPLAMSVIGIDVGSTGTKLAAYDSGGKLLDSVYAAHTPHHPFPGAWELDPEEIWNNAANGLHELTSAEPVKRNPPRAGN